MAAALMTVSQSYSMIRAAKEDVMDACAIKMLVPDGKGDKNPFCVTKPGLPLQVLCDNCPQFASMIWDLITAPGGGPWAGARVQCLGTRRRQLPIIHFEDGVTPGNLLDAANPRKYSGWCWTLRDLPKWLLCECGLRVLIGNRDIFYIIKW